MDFKNTFENLKDRAVGLAQAGAAQSKRLAEIAKLKTAQTLKYSVIIVSTVPLMLASVMGAFFCVVAFLMIFFIIIRKLIFGDPVSGWPSLVCIILMVSGVQFFCTGILGQYLAKTYMEVKRRPIYLVKERL